MTQTHNQAKILLAVLGLIFAVWFLATNLPVARAQTSPASATSTSSGGGLVPCGNGDNVKYGQTSGSGDQAPCTVGDIFKLVTLVTNFLIDVAGIFAVFMIVYAGFSMVTSVGSPDGLKKAKGRLTNAIIGLILVMAAFLLVNTLLSGSLSLGIKNGAGILTNPLGYIKG